MNLLSWIKGLLRKEKKVTYTTLRQKIKDYNKEEYKEYQKLDGVMQQLEDPNFEYYEGNFGDWKSGVTKFFQGALGADFSSEDMDEWLANTENLNAMLQMDVFRAIKDLGIGARGLDTPAERDFLIQVMTGDASSQRATLTALVEERYKATQREVSDFNEAEGTGFYDRFLGRTPRYRKKNQYPIIEMSNL